MDIKQFNEIVDDRILTCRDCGRDFVFAVGEQKYFLTRGLATPKRCPECRQLRRATINTERGMDRDEHRC